MGYYVSSPNCALPEERLSKPLFLPCPTLLFPSNYTWARLGFCETRCADGYMLFEGLCQLCQPSFCGLGFTGDCITNNDNGKTLVCTPLSCGVGFLLSSNGNECEAVVVTPPFQPSQNQKQKGDFPRGGVAHPELQYPRRRR